MQRYTAISLGRLAFSADIMDSPLSGEQVSKAQQNILACTPASVRLHPVTPARTPVTVWIASCSFC